jgi:hypothetical protein
MDKFEKFIRDNRDRLDKYEPSAETWEKISKKTKSRKRYLILRYAAAAGITIIAFITLLFFYHRGKTANIQGISLQTRQDLRETEMFYNSMYQSLYLEAKPLLTGQPEIEKELNTGVAQIDSMCADIRKDLKDNVSNREVIEALIRNYRIKIRLLEDMLNTVKQNENEDKKRDIHEL